ncbi:hypothetical protein [Virgibacillus pantothenticus]|uniref:hypothetical protein n=1 Tax=Virgibacillus pantothenticus TaxID=1473 RepID=UPI001BB07978|nr:hypothetical protein [Virgibacillus pantothenticus]
MKNRLRNHGSVVIKVNVDEKEKVIGSTAIGQSVAEIINVISLGMRYNATEVSWQTFIALIPHIMN